MIEIVRDLKDMLLEHLDKEVQERGSVDRLDPDMVDMVKDLAEAEYYCSVTEAMQGNSGYQYDDMGYRRGYDNRPNMQGYNRSGWANQYGRGYTRRGYDNGMMGHGDAIEGVRNIMAMASPEEKQRIMQEMQQMM